MRRPVVAGFVIIGAYLLSAFVSGRLDIFARRPLLEGNFIPPPYRWVSPPPGVAPNELKPDSKRQNVKFEGGTSAGEFVSTEDAQASIVLPKGAIPPKPGATAAVFSIDPRDPAKYTGFPRKMAVRGNVYEIRASYVGGSNGVVGPLEPPGRIIFSYPAHAPPFLGATHMVVQSSDGLSWKMLPTDNDSPVSLQIATSSSELGFFAVVASPTSDPKQSKGPIILISAVVVVAGLSGFYAWRMSRIRAANQRKRVPRQIPKNQRRRR